MILVDTSVWIDHFRAKELALVDLLMTQRVLVHPFVIGELALGALKPSSTIINLLRDMPQALSASHDEAMRFISARGLAGSGIGYVDAHLLASTKLSQADALWTRDQRLVRAAERMGVAVTPG